MLAPDGCPLGTVWIEPSQVQFCRPTGAFVRSDPPHDHTNRWIRAQTKVVVLTTFDLDEYVYQAIQAGASGFLLKDVAPADLVHAVRGVARGDVLLAPALTKRLLDRFVSKPPPSLRSRRLDALTDRERGVLTLVAAGKSDAEIAAELYLTEATIKTYVSHLLSKLDVRDRVQLTVLAYESGLMG